MASIGYRPDIDGLRAVAVLAILFFHVGFDGFSGGYVGVDIFFVISGFLITSIILRELEAGSFSLAGFYERRVRRILPALLVLLLATLAAGVALLTPAQLIDLGKSALAALGFASNVFFFLGAGYFDGPSEAKPLLHTWSLAVEEQFYILFPLFLVLLARRATGGFVRPLAALTGLSLVASIVTTWRYPDAAFYLIPFRAWELAAGALLAAGAVQAPKSPQLRTALAAAGLLAVLGSVTVLKPSTPFPGVAALAPVLGTAAVILAGGHGGTAVNRMLSLRPLVFIGLISYSLYLWHWPLVVYAKQYLINEPTDLQRVLVVIASLVAATLSWRFVEAPFRNRQRLAPRRRLFTVAACAVVVATLPSVFVVARDGLAGRNAAGAGMADIVAADPGWQHFKDCEELGEEDEARPELCTLGVDGGEPGFLLWGDSHALSTASAVNLEALAAGQTGLLAVRTACPPLLGIERVGRSGCAAFNEAILARLAAEPSIRTVILTARWTMAAVGTRYKNEEGAAATWRDLNAATNIDGQALFEVGLDRTLDGIAALDRRIVLVGQVPEIGYDVPAAAFSARLRGNDVSERIAPRRDEFEARSGGVRAALAGAAERGDVRYVDPATVLCDAERCKVVTDGVPLYRDDNHLSLRGAILLSALLRPAFETGR